MIRIIKNRVGQYSLLGISQQAGVRLERLGWRWARGLRSESTGAWFTTDRIVAHHASGILGVAIEVAH